MTLTSEGRLKMAQPTLIELRKSERWIDTDDGMVMLNGWFTVTELAALMEAASFGRTPEQYGAEDLPSLTPPP